VKLGAAGRFLFLLQQPSQETLKRVAGQQF